jgi:hypothetical protein
VNVLVFADLDSSESRCGCRLSKNVRQLHRVDDKFDVVECLGCDATWRYADGVLLSGRTFDMSDRAPEGYVWTPMIGMVRKRESVHETH